MKAICCGCLTLVTALLLGSCTVWAADTGSMLQSIAFRTLDGEGASESRAGSSPDRTEVELELAKTDSGSTVRDVIAELPSGFAGNLQAVDGCDRAVFDAVVFSSKCPPASQVGFASIESNVLNSTEIPIFLIDSAPNQLGQLGFNLLLKVPLELRLRPSDFGVNIEMRDLSQVLSFTKVRIVLWGVPADHQEGAAGPRRAFLTMPTRCDESLGMTVRLRSWEVGAAWQSAQAVAGSRLGRCEALPFRPHLSFGVSDSKADALTGAQIEVATPVNDDPGEPTSSHIRAVSIDLPEAMSISPSGATGLLACADAQFRLKELTAPTCPAKSRVGSLRLEVPGLRESLVGDLYIAQELPGDRFRLFAVAKGSGTEAKLASSLRPHAGGLQITISNLPEVAFSKLSLSLEGGRQPFLVNPLDCGPATIVGKFEPYNGGPTVTAADTVQITDPKSGSACSGDPVFSPSVQAGSLGNYAGHRTSLSIMLRRSDGEQMLDRFRIVLPPGLAVGLAGVERCNRGDASEGRCSVGSQIGTATAEIGSGSTPALLTGNAFLISPYRSSPLGVALTFPLLLGPFDLGQFTLQGIVRVNSGTGQVAIESESLPKAFEGIPVRLRTMSINIDRPGLVYSPTSCRPSKFRATLWSTQATESHVSVPFLARGCNRLGFRPRVSMALTDQSEAHESGHPGLRVSIRKRAGNTNLRAIDIELARSLSLDVTGLRAICSRQDAQEGICPASSQVGTVVVHTPLLDKPLAGGVYLVQPDGTRRPDLWTIVSGGGLRFDLLGRARTVDGRMHTTLENLPDIPMSGIDIRFLAGDRGVISLAQDRCARLEDHRRTSVVLEGQTRAVRILRLGIGSLACKDSSVGK